MAAKKNEKTKKNEAPVAEAPAQGTVGEGYDLGDAQAVDPQKLKRVNALMAKINKGAKREVVSFADQVANHYMLRKGTGAMGLDIALGGGFPSSGIVGIAGPDGAGKSVLMYQTMARIQRIYGDNAVLALAPVEQDVDHFTLRKAGLMVAVPDEVIDQKQEERERLKIPLFTKDEIKDLKRQVGTFVLIKEDTAEGTLDIVLDFFESKDFHIIGVDSFSAFETDAEQGTESLSDNPRQAAAANVLTRFAKRFHTMVHNNPSMILGTFQVRANRERANMASHLQKYIRPYIPVIPWAIRHALLVGLLIWPGEKMKDKTEDSGDKKVQVGKVINWETWKGKLGIHEGLRGEIEFSFDTFIDVEQTVVEEGMRLGILSEKNGIFSVHRHNNPDEKLHEKIPGVEALKAALRNHPTFDMQVRQEILAAAKVSCIYW